MFIWICTFAEKFNMLILKLHFVEVENLNHCNKKLIFECSDKVILCFIQKIQMWCVSDNKMQRDIWTLNIDLDFIRYVWLELKYFSKAIIGCPFRGTGLPARNDIGKIRNLICGSVIEIENPNECEFWKKVHHDYFAIVIAFMKSQ